MERISRSCDKCPADVIYDECCHLCKVDYPEGCKKRKNKNVKRTQVARRINS